MVAQEMSPWGALLLFLGACTVVALVSLGKDWNPDRIHNGWVAAVVWPVWWLMCGLGMMLAFPLWMGWAVLQAVARWVLAPRWWRRK